MPVFDISIIKCKMIALRIYSLPVETLTTTTAVFQYLMRGRNRAWQIPFVASRSSSSVRSQQE